jgi:hypothetical protein
MLSTIQKQAPGAETTQRNPPSVRSMLFAAV